MYAQVNFILLDAARLKHQIEAGQELNPVHESLFGKDGEQLASVSPYLFTFMALSSFSDWFRDNGWGNSWGIMIQTKITFAELLSHLGRVVIKKVNRSEFYFRFYDPRVLRVILPTYDQQQLKEFFGPVERFICEDEDPNYGLVFSLQNGSLKTNRLNKEEVFYVGKGQHADNETNIINNG